MLNMLHFLVLTWFPSLLYFHIRGLFHQITLHSLFHQITLHHISEMSPLLLCHLNENFSSHTVHVFFTTGILQTSLSGIMLPHLSPLTSVRIVLLKSITSLITLTTSHPLHNLYSGFFAGLRFSTNHDPLPSPKFLGWHTQRDRIGT